MNKTTQDAVNQQYELLNPLLNRYIQGNAGIIKEKTRFPTKCI
ncbi:MAG: hypothetical protein ACLUTA_11485 [Blautia wexlerae]